MRKLFAVGTLLMFVASVTLAQEQPAQGRQGRQGRPGRGQGGRGFGGGGNILSMEEVRKELGTSEEQNGKIDKIIEESGAKMGELFFSGRGGPGGNPGDAPPSEEDIAKRRAEMQEKMAKLTAETDGKIKEVLDEKQNTRYGQLRLQREGVRAMTRKEIAETLKLSEEQTKTIAKAAESLGFGFGGGRGFGGPGRPGAGAGNPGAPGTPRERPSQEEIQKRMEEARAAREKAEKDIVAALTEDQKKQWDEMLGEKFEFPAPQFGGPGAGGPGRRPGGAGRPPADNN